MPRLRKLEKQVLDIIQQEFPVASRPYAELANRLDSTEDEVFDAVQNLREKKIIRRIGGSFDSRKVGYQSTLVALSVPQDRLEEVVDIVNGYPGITHNYEREEKYNVWFTLIAESKEEIERIINEIRDQAGVSALNFPASHRFKIKVDFDFGDEEE